MEERFTNNNCLQSALYVILLTGIFTKISANEVGIIYHDQYGVLEEVKLEGFQTKSIFEHITVIGTSNRTTEVVVAGQTQDSIYATFELTITYRIESENAGKFFKVTNSTLIAAEQLNSVVKASLQANTINYDIYSILGKDLEVLRQDVIADLEKVLLEKFYITLVNLSLDDIDAGPDIEQIIQQKAQAMQEVEIAEQQRLKAEVEAQTAKIKAENEAEIELLMASAKAEAEQLLRSVAVSAIQNMYLSQFPSVEEKIAFETTALGGYLTVSEIGDIVIKQLYYDTWDGVLPQVVVDESGKIVITPGL